MIQTIYILDATKELRFGKSFLSQIMQFSIFYIGVLVIIHLSIDIFVNFHLVHIFIFFFRNFLCQLFNFPEFLFSISTRFSTTSFSTNW